MPARANIRRVLCQSAGEFASVVVGTLLPPCWRFEDISEDMALAIIDAVAEKRPQKLSSSMPKASTAASTSGIAPLARAELLLLFVLDALYCADVSPHSLPVLTLLAAGAACHLKTFLMDVAIKGLENINFAAKRLFQQRLLQLVVVVACTLHDVACSASEVAVAAARSLCCRLLAAVFASVLSSNKTALGVAGVACDWLSFHARLLIGQGGGSGDTALADMLCQFVEMVSKGVWGC